MLLDLEDYYFGQHFNPAKVSAEMMRDFYCCYYSASLCSNAQARLEGFSELEIFALLEEATSANGFSEQFLSFCHFYVVEMMISTGQLKQ